MPGNVDERVKCMIAMAAALLLSAAAGCGGGAATASPASSPTATTQEDDEFSAGLREHHRHHHHGGVTLLIALSLDTLGVSPEQRAALDEIRTDLHAKMEPARAAEQALHALLADGIAAGGIDHSKAATALAQLTAAAGSVHDASVDALNRLHAVLTPPQRAALVDKVEAHWEVWQKANADEQGNSMESRKEGHLARLAGDLALTQDQVDKVRTNLTAPDRTTTPFDSQEISDHVHRFGDAFRSDSFDAKTIPSSSNADAHLAGFGAAHMVRFYEAVDPVLTAEQRTKLAAILREHATYQPNGRGA
jgi:Spy/CpxP family protein refolding chaperone